MNIESFTYYDATLAWHYPRRTVRSIAPMPSQPPSKPNFGRLEKIDVSQYWQSTADFAPWLVLDENIQLLGEAIDIPLVVVPDTEQRTDSPTTLLCRDTATQGWVLIDSQLSPTHEQHLSQLLSQGADIQASAIVWIASEFSPGHLAILNWLNQHTQKTLRFFGVEIQLWQIGQAAMAAQFNLVTPSEPATVLIETLPEPLDQQLLDPLHQERPEPELEPLTPEQEQNLAFWTQLCDQLEQRGSVVKAVTPPVTDQIDFAIGRAGFLLSAHLHRARLFLSIELQLLDEDAQAHYGLLLEQQGWLESQLGFALNWENPSAQSRCTIYCTKPDVNLDCAEQWPEYIDWLWGGLECFHLTFADLIQSLNADDYHAVHKNNPGMLNVLSLPS